MNQSAIRLLKVLREGKTDLKEIVVSLGLSDSQFNVIVKSLIEQDYIEKKGSTVSFKQNAKVILFRDVANRYDVEKILHDSNEQIYYTLVDPHTIDEIQNLTSLSLRTVQRSISELESIGAIKKDAEKIFIDKTNERLYLFAKFLKTETERKTAEPNVEIIYQDKFRILKKVLRGQSVDGELSGFSLFSSYGIDYHTTYDYYIKQTSVLKLEEILIHAILTAYKSLDKNGMAIAILFYLKNRDNMDPLNIRATARVYGISDVWIDIEGYVRNNPTKNPQLFLPRAEFEDKARLYDIPPELYTLPIAYPQLFKEIGDHLSGAAEACLFGGENMRQKGIKDRTKDCDIVLADEDSRTAVIDALEKMGYKSLNKTYFTEDDKRIDPFDILEHPSRSRMDIFQIRIAGKLILSGRMIKRAKTEQFGKLKLHILSNEDIFLLKAVTLREGDIQDMAKIVQAGSFDWDVVWHELQKQEHETKMNFSTVVLESLDFMYEQTGIHPPFYKRLIRNVLDHEIFQLIRDREMSLESIVELLKGYDISEKSIRNRIDYLQTKKFLRKMRKNNDVIILPRHKITLNVYSHDVVDVRTRIKKHVEQLCHELDLSPKTKQKALEMAEQVAQNFGSVGRKPSGLAAAIVYLACVLRGENRTREDIGQIAGLSNPSFSSLYKSVKAMLQL
jgi:predicted transcriptional regulator